MPLCSRIQIKIPMKHHLFILLLTLSTLYTFAQTGTIKGRVFDPINNEAIPFVNVVIQGTTQGTTTDETGNYEISQLTPGLYNLQASFVGYETKVIYEVEVTNSKPATIDIPLGENTEVIDEVVVQASPFNKTKESPLSLRTIGVNEIQRYPGGNRDISKVIQSLPGVASTVSFRNDILIRGGSPAENKFYLDGIEVPTINHFSTQGATGGPVGLINVDFLREVDFYSGAFPANRGNTLSSVMELKQKDGRDDRLGLTFTVGASETALSLEGPMGKKTTFLASARRSYLQLLFKAFELPFLPTYNDIQFKTKTKFDGKNELTVLGLVAIDNFELNLDANETDDQKFLLGVLPTNEQWNYTVGANFKHFSDNGYWTFVLSRSHLNNSAFKYRNNDESTEDNLLLDYASDEAENKARIEYTGRKNGFKFNGGVSYDWAQYSNSTFLRTTTPVGIETVNYSSEIDVHKYGLFGQVSKDLLDDKITLSLGVRADGNSYSSEMSNPFTQLSPRFSLVYNILPQFSFNFNTGIYYQLPPFTSLGFRNNAGELVNKENGIEYIRNKHLVAGLEYNTTNNAKITLEGFYKNYDQYPFLVDDSISLANLGGDFGVIGDEEVVSISEGRAYGFETLFQQKLQKGFYGIVSYTLYWSEFEDKNGVYTPSSWDARHVISLTGGKKFKRNWEIGAVWRMSGGSPYTPFDVAYSAQKEIWDVNQAGFPDYDRLNSERLPWFHQLDIRVDKKFFFKKWSFELYLDIQNAYNFEATTTPYLNVRRDESGNPIELSDDPSRYDTFLVDDTAGQLLPSVGVVISY